MKAIGGVALFGALALSALISVPQASAGQRPQAQFDDAVVVPTGPEVQRNLREVAERLREAQLASVSPTQARDEYLAASRAYEFGMYDRAMTYLTKAETEIPHAPNWLIQANVAAR